MQVYFTCCILSWLLGTCYSQETKPDNLSTCKVSAQVLLPDILLTNKQMAKPKMIWAGKYFAPFSLMRGITKSHGKGHKCTIL